jgi:replication factor A1
MPTAAGSLRSLADERGSDRNFIYLLMLARKYHIEPVALHNALMKAKSNKNSKCGPISIERRKLTDDTFCFMFSHNDHAIAQTAISEYSLAKLRQVPPELVQLLNDRRSADDRRQVERCISDLHVGLKHVSLKAKVINKSVVRAVESRDGVPLVVCSATLSDGTGEIRLPLWNSQIHSVAKNDTVMIREANVGYFRGELQLSIPRRTGSISIVHPAD